MRIHRIIRFFISTFKGRVRASGLGLFFSCAHVLLAHAALASESSSKVFLQPSWLRLLRFQPARWGGYKSQADGPKFFLSPDGRTSPENEGIALLELLQSLIPSASDFAAPGASNADADPRCRFPSRVAWMRMQFPELQALAEIPCPAFDKFRSRLRAKSVSLVFSSFYLNNPASAFGHLLLRLGKKSPSEKQDSADLSAELADEGISFSATVDTGNAVLYSVKGLFGAFPGRFTAMPYYYKIREYNDSETRDLWNYELNLSQTQIDLLVMQLWELGQTWFDYWYVDENCAYHILALIEAVAPELEASHNLGNIVLPTEVLHRVSQSGLVRRTSYRPSLRRQFEARAARVSRSDWPSFAPLMQLPPIAASAVLRKTSSPREQALFLDAVLDDFDLHHGTALMNKEEVVTRRKSELLLQRAKIDWISEPLTVATPDDMRPERLWAPSRLRASAMKGPDARNQWELEYRHSFHDLLDPRFGFPAGAEIEFFKLGVAIDTKGGNQHPITLKQLDFVRVRSLSPITSLHRPISWQLKVGSERLADPAAFRVYATRILVGAGASRSLGPSLFYFALANVELHLSKVFAARTRPVVGIEQGLLLTIDPKFQMLATITPQWTYQNARRSDLDGGWKHWTSFAIEARYAFLERHFFAAQVSSLNRGAQAGLSYAIYF